MAESARPVLIASAACALAAALVFALVFHVEAAHRRDARVLTGFAGLDGARGTGIAPELAALADPVPFAVLGGAVVALALVRRRFGTALAVGAILVAANLTTQALKLWITEERGSGFGPLSWPSGHATASMSLVLCLLLATPVRARPYAGALGFLYVVAVVFSMMLLGWHFPSDVVGGMLIASAWTWLVVGIQRVLAGRRGAGTPRPALRPHAVLRPFALAGTGLAALGAGVLLARADEAVPYVLENASFAPGAALTAALALCLLGGAALVLTR